MHSGVHSTCQCIRHRAFHVINMCAIIFITFLRRTFPASVVRLSRREGWINDRSKPSGPCFLQLRDSPASRLYPRQPIDPRLRAR